MILGIFIVATLIPFVMLFALQFTRDSSEYGGTLPKIGSRWQYRDHVGEVYQVTSATGKLAFIHDNGFIEMAPIKYFMAVAKPLSKEHQ